MAGLLRDWMYLSIDGLLLPDPHAELEAIPSRCDQEEGSVHAGSAVLLEDIDWDLWGLVHLRLCTQVKCWSG